MRINYSLVRETSLIGEEMPACQAVVDSKKPRKSVPSPFKGEGKGEGEQAC